MRVRTITEVAECYLGNDGGSIGDDPWLEGFEVNTDDGDFWLREEPLDRVDRDGRPSEEPLVWHIYRAEYGVSIDDAEWLSGEHHSWCDALNAIINREERCR